MQSSFGPLDFAVLSPPGRPDARLPIAASRAGALGVLDLQFPCDRRAALEALCELADRGRGRFGVQLADDDELLRLALDGPSRPPDAVLLGGPPGRDVVRAVELARAHGARTLLIATSLEDALAGQAAGVDAVVAKGHEAAGWVGEESTFVLLQRLRAVLQVPVWAQGGVGRHTVAACVVAGAEGAVLDAQLLLARESPLDEATRTRLSGFDGSETTCLGADLGAPFRAYVRPDLPAATALVAAERRLLESAERGPAVEATWRAAVDDAVDWRSLEDSVLAVGQDACFAADLSRLGTVAGVLDGLADAAVAQCVIARSANPLAEGAPLAVSHGTRYPLVQGPMTRVSDRAGFAAAVAEAGALPFLALALMRGSEVNALLDEAAVRLGDRPWGVGILGFVPPELREEQLACIREHRPRFALIAGGRPAQARALEELGIETYLHVPSPGLLRLYLREGARRFVFEGRECGGHVGPRTSFVLWDTMVRTLLEETDRTSQAECHVLLAGGIHDGVSAAMAAAIGAPLAERGIRFGALAGTAYLFTAEAVESGAITPGFQAAALACERTVFLESGPGHATRCVPSPFAEEFAAEKRRLLQAGQPAQDVREALEVLNLGRLRIASKGLDRNAQRDPGAPKLVEVGAEDQWDRGMYMIGQVAALRDRVGTIGELHRELADGSSASLEARAPSEAQPDAERAAPPADIAIVGMGAIVPGAADLRTFWANIVNRVDAVGEVPPDRFDWRPYFDADRTVKDKVYSRWGGFIPDVPFDPVEYGMTPNSLRSIEPFQLLGLVTAKAALADAGYADRPFSRERTSVILGAGGGGASLGIGYTVRSSLPMLFGDSAPALVDALDGALPEWTEDSFAGLLMNVAAGRIANRLDLGGTNYTVDAACASALAAVSLGVRELQTGTSDMVIVGGVDAIQTPFAYLCFAKTQALSPSGRCRPFDADADGIAIGEGFVSVVLKRLAEAERDGDRIYAVIRGIGSASDGRDRSLTAPRPEGQMLALRRAYAHAGVSPSTVGLVEAHGTGTVAGDGAEVQALTTVYAEAGAPAQGVAIGSVKSMIGHTKATAGVAGLVKAALALHHGVLPATIGVTRPNPKAGFDDGPFYVNSETRPWPARPDGVPRRAAVSAFGFGGTNFHAVLEEYTGGYLGDDDAALDLWPAELLVWRAESRGELLAATERLLAELEQGAVRDVYAFARELADDAARRKDGGPTLAVVAGSRPELAERLRAAGEILRGTDARHHSSPGVHFAEAPLTGPEGVAFLFPGQGSQEVGMLRDLAVVFPRVRACFDRADAAVAGAFDRPLSRYVFPPPAFEDAGVERQRAELTETNVAQPALGAAGLACLGLLRDLGVEPAMAAGHSYGEFVALAAAGSLAETDLLRVSEARGRFIREGAGEEAGAMVAVTAPADALEPLLAADGELVVANRNAPAQTVLSGSRAAIERALDWCRAHDLSARRLPVACAFHSPYVVPAQKRLAELLREIPISAPRIPVFSNTTAAPYPDDPAAVAAQLAEHLVRPVDFIAEVEAMYTAGARLFVEAGPRDVLSGLVGRILSDRPHLCVPIDRPGRRGLVQLLDGLAALAAEGLPVDLQRLHRGRAVPSGPAELSRSAWMVNAARAWPASEPKVDAPAPVRVTVDDDRAPETPAQQQPQRMVPVIPSSAPSTNGHGNGASAVQPPPEPGVVLPGAPVADRAADVMARYQDVMQQFLETQRSVMLTYLTGRAASDRPTAPNGSLPVPLAALPPAALPVAAAAPAVAPPSAAPVDVAPEPAAQAVADGNGGAGLTREELTARLLAIVSDRTGYPSDMLSLDADLEADLSIDSIKRVEIAGTLMESLPGTNAAAVDAEQMTASRTLREVVGVLEPLLAATTSSREDDRRPFVSTPVDQRIGRFLLRTVEAPVAGGAAGLAETGAVVIVDDGSRAAAALAALLRTQGHAVVRLRSGSGRFPDAAAGDDQDIVVARVNDAASARTAAGRIAELHGGAKALVHLSTLGADARDADGAADGDVTSLLLLAQALRGDLERAAADGGAAVVAATALGGSFGIDGEVAATAPRQALVAGFVKTLAHEWPSVRARVVDLSTADPSAVAETVAAELIVDGPVEIGHRDGARLTVELEPVAVDGRPDGGLLDEGAVLLVTGGARGITAEAAITLAQSSPAPTIVLVGRTPLTEQDPHYADARDASELKQAVIARLRARSPDITPGAVEGEYRRLSREREVRATVARLESAGARVEVRSCDVCDADAFGALIEDVYATLGRIDGVIHGAGLIEDKLIVDKDVASFQRVLATKVTGATILARTLRPDELRFLVLFSSVSGRFGNRGQADYAAASEALNKLAQHLDRRWPARVVAIDWGPWLTTGMVSPAVQRQFAERGVALIDVPTGCRLLEEELRFGRKGEAEVVIGGTTGMAPAAPATPGALLAAAGTVTPTAGGAVEVTRRFELARDRYLTDHRLDGRPVVPFAVATELMAETAAATAGGRGVAELTGIRVLGGLDVGEDGLEVHVAATPDGAAIDVTVAASDEPRRVRYQARAILGTPTAPDAAPGEPLTDLPAFPMTVADAYRDLLFHGRHFQAIVAIEGMDERGLRAVLRPTPPARVLTGAGAARWWMDPVTVDCALQLQVIWARLNWGVTLLPAQIGAVRRVAALEGDAIGLELRVRTDSRAPLCHADHVFTTPDGRLLGTLSDVVGTGSKALNRLAGAGVAP